MATSKVKRIPALSDSDFDDQALSDSDFDDGALSDADFDDQPEEDSGISGMGLLRGGIEALPMAGGVIGGGLGLSGGPIGAMAGAGVGSYAGEALRNVGRKYVLGEEPTREEVLYGPIKEGLLGVAGEGVGGIIGKGVSKLIDVGGSAALNIASIAKKDAETYMKKYPQVEKIINEFGDDFKVYADAIKNKLQDKIQTFRKSQNAAIGDIVETKGGEKLVDATEFLDSLEKAKLKLDPDFQADEIAKINKEMSTLGKAIEEGIDGQIPVSKLHAFQRRMQELSEYIEPGQFFPKKGPAESAFKGIEAQARKKVRAEIPEVAKPFKELQKLRIIDKKIGKGLLKEGSNAGPLAAAGRGENKANQQALRDLSELLGDDFLGDAANLSAAKTFYNPGLLGNSATGRALAPLLTVAGVGYGGLTSGGSAEDRISNAAQLGLGAGAAGLLTTPAGISFLLRNRSRLSPAMLNYLRSLSGQTITRGTSGLLSEEGE